jgi:hypothetical protein
MKRKHNRPVIRGGINVEKLFLTIPEKLKPFLMVQTATLGERMVVSISFPGTGTGSVFEFKMAELYAQNVSSEKEVELGGAKRYER